MYNVTKETCIIGIPSAKREGVYRFARFPTKASPISLSGLAANNSRFDPPDKITKIAIAA